MLKLVNTQAMSQPNRGAYAFTDDDLTLCKQLVQAALDSGDAFIDAFDEAGLLARRQKVKDLFLLLSALSAVFLRLPWPVQRHRPRSDADIDDLVRRVQAAADPFFLNPELCRVSMSTFVKRQPPLDGDPASRDDLYTVAVMCGVAVTRSLENAGTPTDWDARFRRAFRAIRLRIKVPASKSD